jgi:hypothetical protein
MVGQDATTYRRLFFDARARELSARRTAHASVPLLMALAVGSDRVATLRREDLAFGPLQRQLRQCVATFKSNIRFMITLALAIALQACPPRCTQMHPDAPRF